MSKLEQINKEWHLVEILREKMHRILEPYIQDIEEAEHTYVLPANVYDELKIAVEDYNEAFHIASRTYAPTNDLDHTPKVLGYYNVFGFIEFKREGDQP